MLNYHFRYLIFALLVFASIYVDSPFALFMGAAGRCPVFFLSYFLFPFILIGGKKIECPDVVLPLIKLASWLLVVGCFLNVVYSTFYEISITAYNIYAKNIFVFLQMLSYPLYMILLYHFGKDLQIKHVFMPILCTFVFLGVFCVVENSRIPNAFLYLHFTQPAPYYRIRLLTFESSVTSSIIMNFFALSLYFAFVVARNYAAKVLVFVSFAVLLLLSSSKNLYIETIIFMLMLFVFSFKNLNKKNAFLFASLLLMSIFLSKWVVQNLSGHLMNDIENYTSTATRTFSVIVGYLIGLKFPVGVGGGIWQQVLNDTMMDYMPLANKIAPSLNFSEILFYCQHFSKDSTAKSGMAQSTMYWGIVGTIYLMFYLRKFFKKFQEGNMDGKNILLSILMTNLFVVFFQTDFQYDIFLLLSISFILYKKNVKG